MEHRVICFLHVPHFLIPLTVITGTSDAERKRRCRPLRNAFVCYIWNRVFALRRCCKAAPVMNCTLGARVSFACAMRRRERGCSSQPFCIDARSSYMQPSLFERAFVACIIKSMSAAMFQCSALILHCRSDCIFLLATRPHVGNMNRVIWLRFLGFDSGSPGSKINLMFTPWSQRGSVKGLKNGACQHYLHNWNQPVLLKCNVHEPFLKKYRLQRGDIEWSFCYKM